MLNPIDVAFKKVKNENRPALLTYTVAGDSTKNQSLVIPPLSMPTSPSYVMRNFLRKVSVLMCAKAWYDL